MFDDMSIKEMGWDKELQHMFDQHGLLKELAQDGERNVDENKFMVKGPMDESTTGAPMLLELDIASVDVVYDEMPQLDVVWDEEMSSMGMPTDLLQQLAFGSKGTDYVATHANQVKFKAPIASIAATHTVFNGMCPQVTWDAEMQLDIGTHEGLLEQLALGKSYMGEEKTTHMVELNASEVLTHVGDEIHANLGMNENWSVVPETHNLLSQQVAWDRKDIDYEMQKPIAEVFPEDVLANIGSAAVTINSTMQIKDLLKEASQFEVYLKNNNGNPIDESVICNMLIQNNTTSFPMEATIADANEWQQEPVSYDNLSKLVSHEECLVGMDSKTVAGLVTFKLLMATKDSPGELFNGTHCIDVIWDEEPHHAFDSHGILQQIAQGIDDQMHDKHIDFKAFVLSDCDALNMFSKNPWTYILRKIDVEFDVNEKLAIGSECLNGEKMIFDDNIDALHPINLVCVSSQFQNHISCSHNEKMLLLESYVLYPSVCPRKYYGVQNSVFQSFVSSGCIYSSSLRSQCCSPHGDTAIALLRRGVSVYILEKCGWDAVRLLFGNSTSLTGFLATQHDQCSNDFRPGV